MDQDDQAEHFVEAGLAARIKRWKGLVRAAKQRAESNPTHKVIAATATGLLRKAGDGGELKQEVCAQWFSRPPEDAKPLLKSNARVPGRAPLCWALIRALDVLGAWKWQSADQKRSEIEDLTGLLNLPAVPPDWPMAGHVAEPGEGRQMGAPEGSSEDVEAAKTLRAALASVIEDDMPGLLCVRAFSPLQGALAMHRRFRQVLIEFVEHGGCYAVFTPTPHIDQKLIDPEDKYTTLIGEFNAIFNSAKEMVLRLREGVSKENADRIQIVKPCVVSKERRLSHMVSWAPLPIEREQRPCLFVSGKGTLPTSDDDIVRMLKVGNWLTNVTNEQMSVYFEQASELSVATNAGERLLRTRIRAHYEALRPVFLAWDRTERTCLGSLDGDEIARERDFRQAWCYGPMDCATCSASNSTEPQRREEAKSGRGGRRKEQEGVRHA